jgi:UDP-GlcNAc:undecaprenyl-phosphate GlcNAc-1-phosphate transferase
MRELSAYLFLVSLLWMGILTPLAIRLGNRWGVLDVPGLRKIHRNPIPLSGGWAIFLTLTIVLWGHLLAALLIRDTHYVIYLHDRLRDYVAITPSLILKVLPVYVGAAVIFILGLIDDLKGMSVKSRLVYQTLVAAGLAAFGYHPSLGFFPVWVGIAVGILWVVGITNAFNFLDGLDGLSTGVGLVGTLALLTILGITIQPDVVFFLATLAGIQVGFLRYNYHPAKIFLGSSGSLLLGYLMAVLTMQVTYMKGDEYTWLMPLLTPVFIVAIPLYDTASVVLIRLLQNRSIAIGDQSHFHHRLMKLGFSHRQTVAFIVLIAFSMALSAVRLVNANLFQSCVILLQILGMMALIVIAERVAGRARIAILERKRKSESLEMPAALSLRETSKQETDSSN